MNSPIDLSKHPSAARKKALGISIVVVTLILYGLTIYFCARHRFLTKPERINAWAGLLSLCSVASLAATYWFIRRWIPAAAVGDLSLKTPRHVRIVGLLAASIGVALCLPATFRAVAHPREAMVFWHDEGIALEQSQDFITGEVPMPDYRFTQGWVTFLPVVLPLKVLNAAVPVDYVLTIVAMRSYQLLMIFGIVYFTYRLIWQIKQLVWLSIAVVFIAYSRSDFFHIALAIDRPDTFQLLFVVLSLLFAHRFWVEGRPSAWFGAVAFAGLAFASKYSGHLLGPVLLLVWVMHWRKQEVRGAFASGRCYWLSAIALFALSVVLIFPFTFFIFSPYHLIRLNEVIEMFRRFLPIYKSGNVYNVPDFEAPSRLGLWWTVFTTPHAFDYWLTVGGCIGAAICLAKNVFTRSKNSDAAGEWILLAWGACYISFLVYQYGLVDYRYIMPAQYVLPFFLLLPLVWLQNMPALERVPFRPVLGASVLAMVVFFCQQRIEATQAFLASFRSEESVSSCFAVGRYLDRMVPMDEHPTILMTNLAYIPPRFTYVKIHNVDITPALLDKNRFDYVITTDNMYSVYADKPTAGCEQQFCPVYKVHYVDVVDTYTKFKHHTHPDYRHVASFQEFHLFERIHRGESKSRHASNR